MKILTAANDPDVAAGLDYPDHAGWDLADDVRISYGQDGDDGDWIVYVGLVDGEDLYVKVAREQIVEHARQILLVCGEKAWP